MSELFLNVLASTRTQINLKKFEQDKEKKNNLRVCRRKNTHIYEKIKFKL